MPALLAECRCSWSSSIHWFQWTTSDNPHFSIVPSPAGFRPSSKGQWRYSPRIAEESERKTELDGSVRLQGYEQFCDLKLLVVSDSTAPASVLTMLLTWWSVPKDSKKNRAFDIIAGTPSGSVSVPVLTLLLATAAKDLHFGVLLRVRQLLSQLIIGESINPILAFCLVAFTAACCYCH